jgi:hypothetical protein
VIDDDDDDELERIWKEVIIDSSRYEPGICMGGLRKVAKVLSQDILSPG